MENRKTYTTPAHQSIVEQENWSRNDLKTLLQASGELQHHLWQKAVEVRRKYVGDDVLLRGVVEISNYCQKQCDFCAIRAKNKKLKRFRLEPNEIFTIMKQVKADGIKVAFLQGGQEPHCDRIVEKVIPRIRNELGMSVLLNLGEKKADMYRRYAALGASSYILKFETSDPRLYERITHTSLAARLECAKFIKHAGLKLGTGNIIGLPGQNLDGLVDDILLALDLEPDFVSSAPFIPNDGTPLEHVNYGSLNTTLNMMAILRILLKDARIPAISALETIEKGGQLKGLNAGANILTINYTPPASRKNYAIYKTGRFVVKLEHARNIISKAGLKTPDLMY
jgi:biotin synthase